jgi:protein-S-isoprenylcysteine O-methyltransferase Ste14
MSMVTLLLSLAIWGVIHSLLASHFAKDMIRGVLGKDLMRFYRFGYNVFSVVSFAPILYLMWFLPDQPLYRVPAPWSYLMFVGQGISALLLLVALLQTDTLSFIGVKQFFIEGEESGQLVTRGLYRVVRHPLYTFSLLFLWLTPSMSVNSLTLYIGATLYILIGAYFEERKLLRDFGTAYAAYKQKTPMLIPGLTFGEK